MMKTIKEFQGEFRFLSNFWPVEIENEGMQFMSVEHAFQAAKTTDIVEKILIQVSISPGKAKKLGRLVHLKENWEEIKIEVMLQLLRKKFSDPILKQKLIDTNEAILEEGNTWNDTFWGIYNGVGENHLGKLLMKVREECQNA